AVKDREEQAAAHDRVADELRDELTGMRNEMAKLRNEMGEMAENLAARERQAARAQEDAVKIREDMQDLNRQLMELSRTKDDGWTQLKAERDEAATSSSRTNAQIVAIEEENKRLGRLLVESQTDQARGGGNQP